MRSTRSSPPSGYLAHRRHPAHRIPSRSWKDGSGASRSASGYGQFMLDDIAVGNLLARARREVDEGLLPSCQLALGLNGEVVVNEVFGDTTRDTRYVIFSATKAVVAGAVWQLIGSGELDVSRPVADYIPEFGTNDKDVVTVEQVMLHTGGFPRAPLGPPDWANREDRLAAFS